MSMRTRDIVLLVVVCGLSSLASAGPPAKPAPAKAAPKAAAPKAAAATKAPGKGLAAAFAAIGKLQHPKRQWKRPKMMHFSFVKGLSLATTHKAQPRITSFAKDALAPLAGKGQAQPKKLPSTKLC